MVARSAGGPGFVFKTGETMNLNYAAMGYFLILGISLRLACHKSYCVCRAIHIAGRSPNAAENRNAISAVMDALPFAIRESVTRDTPMCLAKSVTVTFNPSSHSCNSSPGWGGLYISLIFALLVIILIVN